MPPPLGFVPLFRTPTYTCCTHCMVGLIYDVEAVASMKCLRSVRLPRWNILHNQVDIFPFPASTAVHDMPHTYKQLYIVTLHLRF